MTRVLVVDDEPQIAAGPAHQPAGPRTTRFTTAADGAEALAAAAAQHRPDLVILDLGLPDLDGVEVIARPARLDAAHRSSCCPAAATAPDKVEALDAGADDYVTKPFGIDELLARMRAVSRRAAAGRRARRSSPRRRPPSTSPPGASRDQGRQRPTSG